MDGFHEKGPQGSWDPPPPHYTPGDAQRCRPVVALNPSHVTPETRATARGPGKPGKLCRSFTRLTLPSACLLCAPSLPPPPPSTLRLWPSSDLGCHPRAGPLSPSSASTHLGLAASWVPLSQSAPVGLSVCPSPPWARPSIRPLRGPIRPSVTSLGLSVCPSPPWARPSVHHLPGPVLHLSPPWAHHLSVISVGPSVGHLPRPVHPSITSLGPSIHPLRGPDRLSTSPSG